ncbi:MAG: polyprenyl synthetase family protein [Alistipes sp.]
MITLDAIRKPVIHDLEAFDAFVAQEFNAEGTLMSEMLRHALSSRGKGIRPTIVMLSALINSENKGTTVGRRAYLAAMLVEMIHTTSLIHDDVIDEADTRRGKPTVNALWQSHKAVLLGDYILAKNLSIGMSSGQYDLVSHICQTMATLCEGEVLQSDCAAKHTTTRRDYLDIIYKKTASLIAVSASAGALSVGAPREKVQLMHRFGEAIGMAFQIQDDILDYSRTANTGKSTNNDLREQKITLPLLVILERVDEARRNELIDKLTLCATDQAAVDYIQQTVENQGGLRLAAEVMHDYLKRATTLLSEYEPSEARTALVNLCAFIAERDH